MSTNHSSTSQPLTAASVVDDCPVEVAGRPGGFAKLGRSIARRTSDLLAIAIVTIAALAMGDELMEWWRTVPKTPAAVATHDGLAWGNTAAPVSLSLGNLGQSIERATLVGSRDQALLLLETQCRQLVLTNPPVFDELDERENRLLAQLPSINPIAELAGQAKLFQIEHPLLMLIGTRPIAMSVHDVKTNTARDTRETQPSGIHELQQRIVCWGVVLPGPNRQWTVFTVRSNSADNPSTATAGQWRTPPGGQRLLSIQQSAANAVTVFTGGSDLDQWMEFFDNSMLRRDWRIVTAWRQSDGGWIAHYRAQPGADSPQAIIQIQADAHGGLRGIVNEFAATQPSAATESSKKRGPE